MASGATRAAAAFAIGAVVMACSSVEPADFEVPLISPGGDPYTLLVYDDSNLVSGGRPIEWQAASQIDDVLAFPDRREIEVGWTGGACQHKPSLEISGNATHLRIDVFNPSDPNWLPFLPIGCPAVGVPLRVSLSLTEPVQEIAVDVQVHY